MYAVIATGGKQYRVSVGDEIFVEKLAGEAGESLQFDQVLAASDDKGFRVGNPELEGAVVEGEIVKQGKQKKIIVFKANKRLSQENGPSSTVYPCQNNQDHCLIKLDMITVTLYRSANGYIRRFVASVRGYAPKD